jgi:type III secretion protein R
VRLALRSAAFVATLGLPMTASAVEKASFAERPVGLMLVLAALALLPFVLIMCTSFLKIVVVLSIVRHALGTTQVPPTQVLTGLAIVLTAYVMAPTGSAMMREVRPLMREGGGAELTSNVSAELMLRAMHAAKEPVRSFLLRHSGARDRALFLQMARQLRSPEERASVGERDLLVLAPAFAVSQLSEAFQIGFLLFVPFLVIDIVVANLLLALGMQMLSPTTVSLPFKLLLFVLVDGWRLLTRGLVAGYQ